MLDQQRDEFVVAFDRRWLSRVFWTMLVLTLAFAGTAVFLTVSRPEASGTSRLILLLLFPVSYLMIPLGSVMTWWAGSKLLSRIPAFTLDSEGISIHFAYQREMRFAWHELKAVEVHQSAQHATSLHACFDLQKEAYDRQATLLQRWLGRFSPNGCPVSIGLMLLDRKWPEIAEAINERATENPWSEARIKAMTEKDWEELRIRLEQTAQDRLTLGGTLVTVEDYRRRFRSNLIGSWSPAAEGFSQSPMDQDVVFYSDHYGFFTEGAFHGPIPFEWREAGDQRLDLQVGEDKYTLAYEIRDTEPPSLVFEDDGSGESLAFTYDVYLFSGLPRHASFAEAMAASKARR